MTGVGLGLGKDYLVEFRILSGSGKTDPFFFGTSESILEAELYSANGQFRINKQVIYYSPNPDETWTYGFGISQSEFEFDTSIGKKKFSLANMFFDTGVQAFAENYPVSLKILLEPHGISVAPSVGIKFFF